MDRKFPVSHVCGMEKSMRDHLMTRLEALLKLRGKKAAPFSGEVGLKADVIRDILRKGSMPSADRLAIIADGLDVSIDYLLGRTDDPSSTKQRPISTEGEILATLERIEGLTPDDVSFLLKNIKFARAENAGLKQMGLHDQSALETDPREFQPSRK